MNITVIGTSNFVIARDGFISSLERHGCSVNNLSLGRVSVLYHIKTIINNIKEIEDSDLLIVDHLLNPDFMAIDNYLDYVADLYEILSSVNTNIVVVNFPSYFPRHKAWKQYTEYTKQLSEEKNISFIDFNDIDFAFNFYRDFAHINLISSYMLSDVILNLSLPDKPIGGVIMSNYNILNFEGECFKNSIVDIQYQQVELNNKITVKTSAGKIVAVEYFVYNSTAFIIDGNAFHANDKGIFHEALYGSINVSNSISISSFTDKVNSYAPLMPARKKVVDKEYEPLKLVSLLIRTNDSPECTPSIVREKINFDLSYLTMCFKKFSKDINPLTLNDTTIEYIRDLAIANESINLELAFDLMRVARYYRPDGPKINHKISEYKQAIKSQG